MYSNKEPMEKAQAGHPIYDKNTLEFVAVAFECCSWLEKAEREGADLAAFVDRATKLLPLLYLKATLLPEVEVDDDEVELAPFITEETYDALRASLATLLGQYDSYLETFMPDMRYSDTPIAAFISENLADLYQDLGNFVSLFREEHEPTMHAALALCTENFRLYWGQALLNALKALHALRYNEEISLTDPTE